MAIYKHVLLATDLSDLSLSTARKAAKLASLFKAKLSMLHCIEPLPAYGAPGLVDLQTPFVDEATLEMAKLGKKIGVQVKNQHVEFGQTKRQVLRLAKELKIDLIVIGSHGHHGITALLGSTASSILHHSDCDVMTIRLEAP